MAPQLQAQLQYAEEALSHFKQAPLQHAEEALSQLLQHLLGFVSYRLVATCIILVPLTHLLTLCLFGWMAKEGGFFTRLLLLNGGKRHQAFHCCGWVRMSRARIVHTPRVHHSVRRPASVSRLLLPSWLHAP